MIDFKEFFTALKVKLVGVLISDQYNPTWKHIVLGQLIDENIEISIENNLVKPGCNFTKDLLAHYDGFLNKAEQAGSCIRNRCVWKSKFITDIGRPLFNQHLVDYGITYVSDFLCEDQNKEYYVPSFAEFKTVIMGGMGIINSSMYLKLKMGIKRAYPGQKLKQINKDLKASILLNKKGKTKGSGEIRTSIMYNRVEFGDINPCVKWVTYFQADIPWVEVYETLYMTTGTNKLLEFQYKLIHRVATSRDMRMKMKIATTDLCHLCGISIETIEHQQFNCTYTKNFRNNLEARLKSAFPDLSDQQEIDIVVCTNNNKIVNFLRIIANWYISKKYHKQKLLWWEEYSAWVRGHTKYEGKLSQEEKMRITEIISGPV